MITINVWLRRYLLFIWIVLICLTTIYITLEQQRNGEKSNEGRFWVFSDSHVDLHYRADGDPMHRCHNVSGKNRTETIRTFGHPECDTPPALLSSAFTNAKKIDSDIDFIIWLGDAASHHSFGEDTVIPANEFVTRELRRSFPSTRVIPVLGNHDVVLAGNRSTRFREFYTRTNYALLLTDDDARETFLKGGYYTIRHQTMRENERVNLRFVVLNTVMFQPQYMNHFDANESIQQIEWFDRTMANAYNLNERILLLAHVPFGINENLLYRFYALTYEQQLLAIINKYSSTIIMCLTAHRHHDIFRVYTSGNTTMGILTQPSISPIGYLTHPSIRKYFYDRKSLVLNDYEQYSLNIVEAERTGKDQWQFAYRFSVWYRQSNKLTSENLFQLVHLIRKQSFYLKRFLLNKHYAENLFLTNHQVIQAICALTLFNFDEFILCTRVLINENIQYENLTVSNTSEINIHQKEQVIQYRTIYRRVVIGLFLFIVVFCGIIYQIYVKCCYTTVENSEEFNYSVVSN